MQVMGVTGKIYGLKAGQTTNGKPKVSFRVGVRKQFVTDADKQNNTTQIFVPMTAMGPTADFITKFFKDGDGISVADMEYQTFKSDQSQQFDDRHIFKVNRAGFVPGGSDANGGGNGAGAGSYGAGGGQQPQQQPYQQPYQQPQQQQQPYQQPQQSYQQPQRQTIPPQQFNAPIDISDDDLPF